MNKGKWKGEAAFLTLVTAAGAFLRFYRIGKECLWYDEVCSVERVSLYFVRLIDNLSHTILFPPLYFLSLKAWAMVAGCGPIELRSFSALWGTAAIPIAYLLAREMFGRRAAVVAAILLALSSFNIYYSQEAKMYAMWWTLVLVSTLFFVRGVKHGGRRRDLWYYVLATAASFWTHNLTVLVVLSHMIYLAAVPGRRERAGKWFLAFLFVFLLYVPWLLTFLAMNLTSSSPGEGVGEAIALTRTSIRWIPVPTAADFFLNFVIFTSGVRLYAFDLETWQNAWHMPIPRAHYLCLLVLAFILYPGVTGKGRKDRWGFSRLILILILFPCASVFIYSWMVNPLWQPRYIGFVSAFLFIAMGYGYSRSSRRLLSAAALGVIIVLNLSVLDFFYSDRVKKPWDELVNYVEPRMGDELHMLFPGSAARNSFIHYWDLERGRKSKRKDMFLEFPYKDGVSIRERVEDFDDIWLVLNYSMPRARRWRESERVVVAGLRPETNYFGSGHGLMHYTLSIDVPGYREERMYFGNGLEVIRYIREESE